MSIFDAWLSIYVLKQFASFFDSTNLELLRQGRSVFKDMAEELWFKVVVRLVTSFELGKRDELWSNVGTKYIPDA